MSATPPVQPDNRKSTRSQKHRLWWLFTGILLLIAALLWFWHDLHQFHIVMSFDDSAPTLQVREGGFLVSGIQTPFTFYDWYGHSVWHANREIDPSEDQYDLSPNGRYLSLLNVEKSKRRNTLSTWENGKQAGILLLPFAFVKMIHQLDDGRVFVSGADILSRHSVVLIQENRIIAATSNRILWDIAPDLHLASVKWAGDNSTEKDEIGKICSLSIKHNSILLPLIPFAGNGSENWIPLRHGKALCNGFVYQNGTIQAAAPGTINYDFDCITANKQYAAFFTAPPTVVSFETGQSWTLNLPKDYLTNSDYIQSFSMEVSENGRFLAFNCLQDAYWRLRALLKKWPQLTSRIPVRQQNVVTLFEQPGTHVASFTSAAVSSDYDSYFRIIPSPDGKAMVGIIKSEKDRYRCVLLRRWL